MARLHELLAVEGDLEGTYRKILEETKVTFTKKAEHFMGFIRTLQLFDEKAPPVAPDYKELDTTIDAKLDYQKDHIIRYLDAVLQKEMTNTAAKADLVVDGKTIAKELPATFLLGLETKLKHIRDVYSTIPTLQPGVKWEKDESRGKGVYVTANPEETYQTEKVIEAHVLYKATKEHPAQVKEMAKTIKTGRYSKLVWSGMLSTAEKSILLGKIDKLIRAAKQARQRANTTPVITATVAKELFNFIES
ncbi:MAG: hypothetical protein E3J43_04210 [Candidatus Heimdallarchaeota archaeon]|nr:MAG: hypothetical protein E3J43_04210 [Candidatus Heimdallarchaeota archaeon]